MEAPNTQYRNQVTEFTFLTYKEESENKQIPMTDVA
jgi:hypothetical protein